MAGKTKSKAERQPKGVPLDKRLPAHRLVDVNSFAFTSAELVETAKINEIASLLWVQPGVSEAEHHAKVVKAIDLFESLKPTDGLESMLAAQMIGTHSAAMECLRRAMISSQSSEAINMTLTQAGRLMTLYLQQVAALDRRRGKGQQKITVERVQVAAGGQAIVGHVQTMPSLAPDPAGAPAVLQAPMDDATPLPAGRPSAKVPR